jgi:lysophospholipase L1-like esterase
MHRPLAFLHLAILLLALLLLTVPIAVSQPSSPPPQPASRDTIAWHVVAEWGVEGRGWSDVKRFYDRLPARAEGVVRDAVWELSHNSAGMSCRFTTDAAEIQVRYTLLSPRLDMTHMPASGVSGVDLYTLVQEDQWRYMATVRPASQRVGATVARGIAPGRRTYLLNLPLYNGIDSLEIGVTRGAAFEPILPRSEKPVVFYGTSITQGGCASRPGMAFPAILGRRLNVPVINLGFSGNGRMDPEIGRLLTELDAAVFVLDCLANLTPEQAARRTEPFVRLLREAKPGTPIVLVENPVFAEVLVLPDEMKVHRGLRTAVREAYDRLIASGIQQLYYIEGDALLGQDGEATVDGTHPSDLGMIRYADELEKVLKPLLH